MQNEIPSLMNFSKAQQEFQARHCPNRLKAELQTLPITRRRSRITHHASRHP
jgi:hypothetical protein